MPCYRPQPATQAYNVLTKKWSVPRLVYPIRRYADGAREFVPQLRDFSNLATKSPEHRSITLPCGLCFGCRIDNARSWSLRMMHQSRYHDANYFITLTYAPEHMPPDGDLRYKDLQNFFKRARHEFQTAAKPFKYFACGEYGDQNLRPHYHFAGFDFKLDDLRHFKNVGGSDYFLSDALRECWGFGHVIVGALEYDSAAYIARYVTKKMHGSNVRDKGTFDPETGEVDLYTVERAFQSKGLGLPFYQQHHREIWDLDACLFNRKYLVKPPRYYMKQLIKSDPDKAASVMEARRLKHGVFEHIDVERDRELLYQMKARRLQMQTLKRSL